MRTIPLTKGQVALVDDADYEWLAQFRWCLNRSYAYRVVGGRRNPQSVMMHRFILGLPHSPKNGVYVDHIDGNGLNNQRANLRLATKAQNSMNRPAQSNNKCGLRGVSVAEWGTKWRAVIAHGGKRIWLGYHYSPQAAARAYDAKAVELFGPYSKTNASLGLL